MAYARWRITQVLKKHILCPTRELEARISDFASKRLASPNPHHVNTAMNQLLGEGLITRTPVGEIGFYSLKTSDQSSVEEALRTRAELYARFKRLSTNDDICGKFGEEITYRAIRATGGYGLPSRPGRQVTELNGAKTPHGLDLAAYGAHGAGQLYRLGIEVKNGREWIYPESWPVWKVIGSSIELDAIPILVARRFHYITFVFFKFVGALGHQTRQQYFAPQVDANDRATLEAAEREFFFKDLAITDQPSGSQVEFFRSKIPELATRSQNSLLRYKQLLTKYAVDQDMWSKDMSKPERSRLWHEFREEFREASGYSIPSH